LFRRDCATLASASQCAVRSHRDVTGVSPSVRLPNAADQVSIWPREYLASDLSSARMGSHGSVCGSTHSQTRGSRTSSWSSRPRKRVSQPLVVNAMGMMVWFGTRVMV
jgi:hypothetical protein